MTQQRNIHGWHLLTLVLAFVAGGALTMHLPSFKTPEAPIDTTLNVPPDVQQDVQTVSNSDSIRQTVEPIETISLSPLTADDLPLFLQNELDDLRFEAERSRAEIVDLREQLLALAATDIERTTTEAPVSANVLAQRPNRRPGVLDREALIQAGVTPELVNSIQQR